jgi:hypothetical protein
MRLAGVPRSARPNSLVRTLTRFRRCGRPVGRDRVPIRSRSHRPHGDDVRVNFCEPCRPRGSAQRHASRTPPAVQPPKPVDRPSPRVSPAHPPTGDRNSDPGVPRPLVLVQPAQDPSHRPHRHDPPRRDPRAGRYPSRIPLPRVEHGPLDNCSGGCSEDVGRQQPPSGLPGLQRSVDEERRGPGCGIGRPGFGRSREPVGRSRLPDEPSSDGLRNRGAPHEGPGNGERSPDRRGPEVAPGPLDQLTVLGANGPGGQPSQPIPIPAPFTPIQYRDLGRSRQPQGVRLDDPRSSGEDRRPLPVPLPQPRRPDGRHPRGPHPEDHDRVRTQPVRPPQPRDLRRALVGAVGQQRHPFPARRGTVPGEPGVERDTVDGPTARAGPQRVAVPRDVDERLLRHRTRVRVLGEQFVRPHNGFSVRSR